MKNAIIYRITDGLPDTAESLSQLLYNARFMPCSLSSPSSSGWIPPAGHSTGMAHQVGKFIAISMQTESKILPRSVIVRATNDRAAEIERAEGWRVGRRERREIAEAVMLDLLPKAFTKIDRVNAYIDTENARLMVDTPSASRADDLVSLLLRSVGGLAVKRFRSDRPPSITLAEWMLGNAPDYFSVDDCAVLVREDGDKPTVKYQHHNLDREDIRAHLAEGKAPTLLSVTYNDRVSFVLTDQLHIKRVDLVASTNEHGDGENEVERFDSDVALYCGEMTQVVDAIEVEFGAFAE